MAFAGYLGVSDQVIGLTIIAADTTLPEVVTSIIAALRGERDIALSPAMIGFDLPVMIAVALNTLSAPLIDAAASLCQGHV